MWAFFEIFVFVFEVLLFLPPSSSTEQRPAKSRPATRVPDWVRWPIYGVILMGVLTLTCAGIVLLFV